VIPGLTVQLEDHWLDETTAPEVFTSYAAPALSLILCSPAAGRPWTRLGGVGGYLPLGDLTYEPANVERHTYECVTARRDRTLSCYFDPAVFSRQTGLDLQWTPAYLKSCSTVGGPLMVQAMEHLLQEVLHPSFASNFFIDSLGRLLVVQIARHFETVPKSTEMRTRLLAQRHINRLREFLDDTSCQGVTVQDLADACGLTADHLRRTFKYTTGQSLGAYVEEIRVSKAKTLLVEKRMAIKQIAYQLGFANPSSFCVAFRRATGETPSAYRARLRI